MPFFQLSETDTGFPPAHFADEQGMIAVGGDLSVERLLNAYQSGIYFWFSPMDFIKWWSPDPRLVLKPEDAEPPEQLPGYRMDLEVTFDQHFELLLRQIQEAQNTPPMGENWVTEQMAAVYRALFEQGYAHSLEVRHGTTWVGGIFGVAIGKAFFAEYTYSCTEGGGALSLSLLARQLQAQGYHFIDVQKPSIDTPDLGFTEMSRLAYLDWVKKACL
ncbi:leucyl/phenylalanyl-tRNA--protein transferase [Phaeodactylibacter xiamenensis]|uniref:leucyl/phenylalanyl-tRNA--protein transferase n=1 Tax=Phaeodactylibacter xiamenensis TaxID=1524460 RepID=UPI0024A9A734|nr:leucyl/phenylalanyl-tRNA--protein transferase [Phaeodactylibacter xiamenensis]